MLKARIFVAFLFAGVVFFSGCSKEESQPMAAALKYAGEKEWAKADKPSAEALSKTPDNINALILRSIICENLNRYDEAVENARKAVSIDSSSFAANYTLGRLYAADRRRKNEAIDLLIKASRLRSERPEPLVLLCNLHAPGKKGSYLAALSRMPEYANAPEVAFESCMNQIYNGNYQGVDAIFIRLFNSYPDHPELTSALGGYYNFRRNKPMAKAAFKRYLAFPEGRRTPARTARATKRLAALK